MDILFYFPCFERYETLSKNSGMFFLGVCATNAMKLGPQMSPSFAISKFSGLCDKVDPTEFFKVAKMSPEYQFRKACLPTNNDSKCKQRKICKNHFLEQITERARRGNCRYFLLYCIINDERLLISYFSVNNDTGTPGYFLVWWKFAF